MDDVEPVGRALRADARTNRVRILEAADAVFGRGGELASTEEVARVAGVGIGTVFRHFPTKAALLEAVVLRRFRDLRDRAVGLAGATDPGRAFFDFFSFMVADAASKIALVEALVAAGGEVGAELTRASAELREAVGELLRAAKDSGAVRGDADLEEVYALLVGLSRAAALGGLDAGVRARALGIVFDGLAGTGSGPGGHDGPATRR